MAHAWGGDGVNGDGVNGDGVDGEGADGEGVNGDGVNGKGVNGKGVKVEGVHGEGVNGEGVNGKRVDVEGVYGQGVDAAGGKQGVDGAGRGGPAEDTAGGPAVYSAGGGLRDTAGGRAEETAGGGSGAGDAAGQPHLPFAVGAGAPPPPPPPGAPRLPLAVGAEWWVQRRPLNLGPREGGIQLHWDCDEQWLRWEHVPPLLATVSYVTSGGAPTLVLPVAAGVDGRAVLAASGATNGGGWFEACESIHNPHPPLITRGVGHQSDPDTSPTSVAQGDGGVVSARVAQGDGRAVLAAGGMAEGWAVVSHPVAGKHLAFDGRLLHGAPAELARPAKGEAKPIYKYVYTSIYIDIYVYIYIY